MENQLELYKSIIDEAVDAIFVGNKKGNFVFVNKSAEKLTGYSKEELLALNMSNLFPSDELESIPLNYKSLDKENVITKERTLLKKDGSKLPVEMKSKLLASEYYQSFIRDITERKEIEKNIVESETRYKHTL